MKNKILSITILAINFIFFSIANSDDQFIFDITEVEIIENGNKFIGKKRGIVRTGEGLSLEAEEFEYDKILNILNGKGDVKIVDKINSTVIYTDEIVYLKNQEIIFTKGNSKAIEKGITITADNFEYNNILNILNANKNVKIIDKIKDHKIFTDNITYLKNKEKIFTEGDTQSIINSEYIFNSKETIYLRNENKISSSSKSTLSQNNLKMYKFDQFEYSINDDLLKAKNIQVISENLLNNGFSDNAKFSDGFFQLKDGNYIAGNSEFKLKKDTLGVKENDPRLVGASSLRKNEILEVNKGIFTSCNANNDCPAWSIEANKIKHDAKKKQLIYENAILKLYNKPVFYFPKFFHPDPTVKRQSGILTPAANDDDVLGSSVYLPYFYVISENKDLTIKPTFFEDSMFMLRNEYRQENKNSAFVADFNFLQNYKPRLENNKKNISHFFSKYKLDLNLKDYDTSNLDISVQKVSNDTYLKVFDTNLIDMALKPSGKSNLESSILFNLSNENFSFDSGFIAYENLNETKTSDRYQFTFPHYSYSKTPKEFLNGFLYFNSTGDNRLINTNNLKSKIVNDINYEKFDIITSNGFKNNFNAYFKNVNRMSENDAKYKSSAQVELATIFESKTSFPLMKVGTNNINYLIPKISFRLNPSDMNASNSGNNLSVDNVFSINRLGLSDTYESGKSLTVGLDYKKEDIEDINKYFEIKLGSVFRDIEEDRISANSTINRKTSNLFGSINSNFSDFFKLEYDFAVDNDLNTFENNNIKSTFVFNKLTTEFQFTEINGEMGDTNILSNTTTFNFDDNNSLYFNTRRNRKISLTEYYDLIYEYKNDCLSAGIKYKKTYYSDRELTPKEDLLLTLTIFPITTYEHEVDQSVYRGPNSINDLFDDL